MRRHLPQLNAFRAIEAAACHLNISLAAISHRIRLRMRDLNTGFNRAWSHRLDCWIAGNATLQPSDSEDSAAGEFMMRHLIDQPQHPQFINTRKRRSAGSF